MKHLKKINETFRDISDQIVDILVDIKDDYPEIDGDIFDIEGDIQYGDNALCLIVLDCEKVKIRGEENVFGSIEHYRSKIKFINLILDSIKRLEDALNVKAFIPNLDQFDHWQYSSIRITLYKK